MLKRKEEAAIENWIDGEDKALLITGARQTGKTYLIRKKLEQSGYPFVEVNFIENPEYVRVLANSHTPGEFYTRICAIADKPVEKGKTIVFMDEIQEYKDIVTRIKFLVEEGDLRFIMSGSLLGVELRDLRSAPVGYLRIIDMYPMDLKEFFEAVGVSPQTIDSIFEAYKKKTPMDSFVHEKLMDIFYLYLIVGGMPEAVQTYIDTNDIGRVNVIQENIIRLYKQDFTKYEDRYKLKLIEIYDAVPSELDSKNKRFFINHLGKGTAYERIKDDFLWLKNAGVALPVYNVTELTAPLRISEKRNLFKLFMSDVGLLTCLYPVKTRLDILSGSGNVNNGALFENVAAQELFSRGFSLRYYNSKKLGELDFVIELDGEIMPVEIKSGKDYSRHRAMDNVLLADESSLNEGFVFSKENVKKDGKITYLPVYMLMCVENTGIDSLIYRLDLEGI